MSTIIDRRTIRTNKEDYGYGTSPRTEYNETKSILRSYNLIWFIVGFINVVLVFRFFFELLGANPYNAFTQFIYALSYPFAAPFRSIFGVTNVATAYFDWSILVAIIVYLLIGYGLVQLLRIAKPVTRDDPNQRMVV